MPMTPQAAELIERSLECHYWNDWDLDVPTAHFQGWRSFSTPVISLMLRGATRTSIRGPRPQTVCWQEGQVICLLPDMARFHCIISGETVHYRGVAVSFETLHGLDLLSFFELPVLYAGPDAQVLGHTLQTIIAAGGIECPFRKAVVRKALCLTLLRQLLEPAAVNADAVRRWRGIGRVAAAVEHLLASYAEEPDIAHLARLCSLSKSRFHAVFRETVGCAPGEFAKRRRLDEAATLLATSDLRIAEVGRQLGWHDPFHFSRIFKGFFGVSPRRYRENLAAGIQAP